MELLRDPFKGVITDVKGRAAWYTHDWVAGFHSGFRSVLFKLLALDH
jgi:boron transporter